MDRHEKCGLVSGASCRFVPVAVWILLSSGTGVNLLYLLMNNERVSDLSEHWHDGFVEKCGLVSGVRGQSGSGSREVLLIGTI